MFERTPAHDDAPEPGTLAHADWIMVEAARALFARAVPHVGAPDREGAGVYTIDGETFRAFRAAFAEYLGEEIL